MVNKYAFILGRVYTLSVAELFFYFEKSQVAIKVLELSEEVLIIETTALLDVKKIQAELGGIVKVVSIVDEVVKKKSDLVWFVIQNYFKLSKLKSHFLKQSKGKIQFGISIYLVDQDIKAFGEPLKIGMQIKRVLQDNGMSIRLVLPKFNALTIASVAVTHNHLIEKGAEICIMAGHQKLYIGKTVVVQDFENYGRRDYQRPVRDEKQGMIPPKVAQMMINFTGLKIPSTLLDPMCGIGTIVQEGILQGYKVLGTDINSFAVAGSEKNLEWFRNRFQLSKGGFHLEVSDVRDVNKIVENLKSVGAFKQIDAIVTEGDLGPIYFKFPSPVEIAQNFQHLTLLYTDAFKEFSKFLSKGARVVICFPAYKRHGGYTRFENIDFIKNLGYNIIDLISKDLVQKLPFLQISDRGTAYYDRKDQIVAREIIIFEKI